MDRSAQVRWSEAKVGLLVLIALTILIVMILNLEQGIGLFTGQSKFRAVVDHTQGLKVGGPVRMNGVDVGNVHAVRIAEDSPAVEIIFVVNKQAAAHIREDASVSIRQLGLLGDKFLELFPGTPTKPALPPGSLLSGRADPDAAELAVSVGTALDNVNAALLQIQQLVASINQGQGTASKLITDPGLYDRSQRVLEKLEEASEKSIGLLAKVERGEGTIGQLVSDKSLYRRADQILRELDELADRLNNQNGTLVRLADPTLYNRLDHLTIRGEQLLAKIENGEGTFGKLVSQDELYSRADKLLSEVENLVTDVKKHPTKYFKFSLF